MTDPMPDAKQTDAESDAAFEAAMRFDAKYLYGNRFHRAIFDAGRTFERSRQLKDADAIAKEERHG